MVHSWKAVIRRFIVLIVLITAVAAVISQAGKQITKYNEQELQRNIHSVMEQNVDTITLLLDKHKTLVEGTAARLAYFANDDKAVQAYILRQHSSKEVYNFLRIGFIYPDGTCIASDGSKGNLAMRDYFVKSMQGEFVITPPLKSILSDIPYRVSVFSAPVKDKNGKIIGVVFESVPSSVFDDSLSRGIFAEFGSNALVNNDGVVIASENNSTLVEKYSDLLVFVTLESSQKRLNVWQERITNTTSTTTMYFDRDGGQYLHFAPIELEHLKEPLHIAVLLSADTIKTQTQAFAKDIYHILLFIIIIATVGTLYYFVDIQRTERNRRQELEKIAYTSPITQDVNYAYLKKQLSKSHVSGYLAYMDLRDFEIIRSSHGVQKSRAILQQVWTIITRELGTNDCAGHIANDYFAILFATKDLSIIEQKLYSINTALATLSEQENVPPIAAFFGLQYYSGNDDIDVILSQANIAKMSITNKANKVYALYDAETTALYLANTDLEKSFTQNLEDGSFEVWYQPKYNSISREIIGAEALIRLRDKDGKLVPPYRFIPLFEKDGLIRALDEYVFQSVCNMQKQRILHQQQVVPISINLSRVSLYYYDIVNRYVEIVKQADISPDLVPLEITESATVNNKHIHALMSEFSKHGFKMHMDDFGSGYSSLSALNILPFTTIKLDKSIIDFIGSPSGDALLTHIIALAHDLGLTLIAEGVETEGQLQFLKEQNCYNIQGYYFSPPLEYEKFSTLLETVQKNQA